MKKTAVLFLALLIGICVVVLAIPYGLPNLNGAPPTMAVKADGTIFIADANLSGNWVYSVKDGQLSEVYYLPRKVSGKQVNVRQLCTDGTNIALLQSEKSGEETFWRVMHLGQNEKYFKEVCSGKAQELPNLSIENGQMHLVFLSKKGTVAERFSINETEDDAMLVPLTKIKAQSGQRFTNAIAFNSGIWGMGYSGKVFQNNAEVFARSVQISANLCSVNAGIITFFDNVQKKAYVSGGLIINEILAPTHNYEIIAGSASDENNIVFLAQANGKTMLLRYAKAQYEATTSFDIPFSARFAFKKPLLIFAAAVVLAAFLLTSIVYWLLKHCRKLALRLVGICTLFILIIGVLFVYFSKEAFQRQIMPANKLAAKAIAMQHSAQIKLLGLQSAADFNENALISVLDALTQKEANSVVVTMQAGEFVVLAAQGVPAGTNVRALYGAKVHGFVINAALKDANTEYVETAMGQTPVAYSLQAIYSGGVNKTYVLTIMPCNTYLQSMQSLMKTEIIVLLSITGLFLLVAGFTVFTITKPIKSLAKIIQIIKDGKVKFMPAIKYTQDEVGDLGREIKAMFLILSVREYEFESAIYAYRRFVPEGIEKLLKRGTAAEINSGDMAQIKGCVAFVCVTNRADVRAALDDKSFMDFVNRCYASVYNNAQEYGGILLENAFNLSSLKILFKGEELDADSFSIALMDTENAQGDLEVKPTYFQLLHETSFLYGVTGGEKRAINFLSSMKIDFLEKICAQFEKINCPLVVTGQYLKKHASSFNTRYIGFVCAAGKDHAYELYEVLDVYGSIERSRRQQYSDKFQTAIKMYYKNQFHEARNAFSGMLKICPTDGVARWYLHACEYYSQAQNAEEISYALFALGKE